MFLHGRFHRERQTVFKMPEKKCRLKTVCCVDKLFLTTCIDTSIFLINVSMFFTNLFSMRDLGGMLPDMIC